MKVLPRSSRRYILDSLVEKNPGKLIVDGYRFALNRSLQSVNCWHSIIEALYFWEQWQIWPISPSPVAPHPHPLLGGEVYSSLNLRSTSVKMLQVLSRSKVEGGNCSSLHSARSTPTYSCAQNGNKCCITAKLQVWGHGHRRTRQSVQCNFQKSVCVPYLSAITSGQAWNTAR